jgi:hypothetical protein
MMTIPKITALALFGMVLVYCAPPKPTMVLRDNVLLPKGKTTAPPAIPPQAEAIAVSKSPKPTVSTKPTASAVKSVPGNDAIRMPDMLGLPGEGDFRTTQPKKTEPGSEAVIARPPKE